MEPPDETDPDQFEIQIKDDEFEPVMSSTGNVPQQNCYVGKANEVDLLRASLSDVILNQSLQYSERSIDFEDSNVALIETSDNQQQIFDSIADDKDQESNIILTFPDNAQLPVETCNDKPSGDAAADFEDEVDPLLLSSFLKNSKDDSDDEFDFDLPTSKVDKGKSVRFSGGCDTTEPTHEETKPRVDDEKEEEKPTLTELSGQCSVPPLCLPSVFVSDQGDVKPVVTEVKIDAIPQIIITTDDKPEQDSEEREDRRHIITSSAADWDNVETVEAGFTDVQSGEAAESMSTVPAVLSFSDVWHYFRAMDHTAVKDKIQVTVEKRGVAALVSRLFGPPKMHKDLHVDRELVFCIAATAFDNQEDEHLQSLQTIYRVLTGSRFNCPRYGSHWEEIGFQGHDPATDLRGAGMLALIQLVSFLQEDNTAHLARDLYKLSLHPTQNFPFCLMCINMSRIALQALREGSLNRECNSQKKVMPVVNEFYAGTLLYLYRVWQQGKTITDSGFVIKEIETRAKKQPKEVFKDMQAYASQQKAGKDGRSTESAAPKGGGRKDDGIKFFSVVKSDTKTAAELY